MRINDQNWNILNVIKAFFPFQLIVAHLKYNLFSLLFWVVFFLIVSDKLGYSFGIPLLFLSPEYLGEVSAFSFFIVGLAFGGFIIGFNTYSYIKVGAHFPFLTTIAKPFFKFCINNALIPVSFSLYYIYKMIRFQHFEEFASTGTIISYILSFSFGTFVFIVLSFLYFLRVSRKRKGIHGQSSKPISSIIHKKEKWYDIFRKEKDRKYIYIGKGFKLIISRSSKHFDQKLVQKVYAKNRISSSLFELLTITLFFILGILSEYKLLELPAAASIVLLFTIFVMLFSALHSWLRGWIYPIFIIVIFSMDFLSTKSEMFNYTSYAYGLNYNNVKKDNYNINRIKEMSSNKELLNQSYESYIQTLENWKKNTGVEKPKLIIINTSGGGSRSALWTMVVMQETDKALSNSFSSHTQLITGASGGMIGAAYYRELLLRAKTGRLEDLSAESYRSGISKDILNKLTFTATTSDIFIRYKKCKIKGYSYTSDRGYAFEEQLHQNTDNFLRHNLNYYKSFEQRGTIPTMIFSPTIINDGRRLIISSQEMHFLTSDDSTNYETQHPNENIEFHSLLENQKSNDIQFSTVLRANASFPFVMPMISLPTTPRIQLMDAGIRDNLGGKTMMEFLNVMNDWISKNTSGVIVVQIRDTKKQLEDETNSGVSFLSKITLPFGNMYKNFPRVQDYNQDELIRLGSQSYEFPIDIISFNLRERVNDRISLSWHLTTQEKKKIYKAYFSESNQNSLNNLKSLVKFSP